MRIAMLAPISWRTPPIHYGPWEYVTSLLTEALVDKGIDVTLFATKTSRTKGNLEAVCPAAYSEDPTIDAKVWEILHVSNVFEQANRFDIIHNQADFIPLAFTDLVKTPIVTTIHGFSSEKILPVFEKYNDRVHYVSISDSDRSSKLDYAATIHHGIRTQDLTFEKKPGEHLLFFGRFHPDKGAHDAIEVAKRSKLPLKLAGIVQEEAYFKRDVEPYFDGKTIAYLGAVGGDDKKQTLAGAKALLHLVHFDEPFGLSVVEALASGTPVIAYRRGSMPEIIDHGKTGFLVDTLEEAVEAVENINSIDRAACRQSAIEKFSVERMADDYTKLYEKILRG